MTDEIDYTVINPDKRWRMLRSQWRFALWALWISSGVMMQGFDIVAGSQLVSLPAFRKQFGILEPTGNYLIPAYYISAWSSIAPACEIVATFIVVPSLEKFGRKPGIMVATMISVAGVLLQQLATDWRTHLAGRGVNGIAIGIMFTISPLWIGETCRPELRGFFLCFFNTSIVFGQFAIVVVSKGASHIDGKWQWWLPVVAMYIFPFILTTGWFFFPESPYWLVRYGKSAQAKKELRKVYGFNDDNFYDIEIRRMEEEIRLAAEIQETADTPNYNGQQMVGATFVIGYATYFLELIHVKAYFDASVVLYVVMLLSWFVLASEIATMRLRGATQGLVTISNAVWGLVMQFTIPYMINPDAGNLGGKVGFIFLGTGLVAAIGGWFLYPETKGIPLEKIDELYALHVAPRHFKRVGNELGLADELGPVGETQKGESVHVE
ncbi:hypothetical protein N7519_000405 [Penicillium mononematosum]|uniref:uncharacterized protein n=1 Tax=Penicillium mononematosum TaxID=268346 RepID=UPI0025489B4A|nr:uncharacterized protein N7519_000405 [Penicillium mononematosum]KAJ6190384.1 hypothetical protein N7519_000405 [Penicillium mononematosum]